MPRPALIAAFGALILAVTFAVTKAGDTDGGAAISSPGSSGVPATQTATTPTDTSTSTSTTSTSTSTTTQPTKSTGPQVTPGQGLPPDVARALNRGNIVVLFFYEPAAADDQATRSAVQAVRRGAGPAAGRVSLFQDVVARISSYRRVVGSLGISQSPALVVIDRDRKAELLQGYLDSGTIEQTVRDAL